MLKRIRVDQLEVGMFVARLDSGWMAHPFWRSRFLLASPTQIHAIVAAGVKKVWIDTAKGKDLPSAQPMALPEALQPIGSQPEAPAPLGEELARAREVLDAGKAAVATMFQDVRLGKALETKGALTLVDAVARSLSRHSQALVSLVRLKELDDHTYMHSFAVCVLMIALGRTLELNDDEVYQLGLAGLLHDIGKTAVPAAILNKAGALTQEEIALWQRHPSAGYRILTQAGVHSNIALEVCQHHHERLDGSGYPFGLAGSEISLYAKIAAVCDTYDTLTSNRPAHRAWPSKRALQYMMTRTDTLFDRTLVQALTRTVGIYPVGTVLKLRSNRLGLVAGQNDGAALRPRLLLFFSINTSARLVPMLLDLRYSDDDIVSVEEPSQWGFTDAQLMPMLAMSA
jgi:putative nucleotidyltransferase with HDIG domain